MEGRKTLRAFGQYMIETPGENTCLAVDHTKYKDDSSPPFESRRTPHVLTYVQVCPGEALYHLNHLVS